MGDEWWTISGKCWVDGEQGAGIGERWANWRVVGETVEKRGMESGAEMGKQCKDKRVV